MTDAITRIKELDAERQHLLAEARETALAAARQAIADLNSLGLPYRLTEEAKTETKVRKGKKKQSCKVCGFTTEPAHNSKRHEHQEEPHPFTNEELAQLGLQRA